jgi:acetyl-CoA synthetase
VPAITIRDGYGPTETTAQIGNPPGAPLKASSMGRTLPGYQIVLWHAEGEPTDEGEICSDLAHRPTALMNGYADDTEKTVQDMTFALHRVQHPAQDHFWQDPLGGCERSGKSTSGCRPHSGT